VQGTCVLDTGCRGARLLVWLILNDRVQPSFIAGVCTAVPPCELHDVYVRRSVGICTGRGGARASAARHRRACRHLYMRTPSFQITHTRTVRSYSERCLYVHPSM
jgi:hypothetical protein